MLEVRYNTETGLVTGWCGDETQFGNLDRGRPDEAVVILDIGIPEKPSQAYLCDSVQLLLNPDYVEPEPPRSTHMARIESFDESAEKPLKVKRAWEGKDYYYDCYVTQTLKDEYVAGQVTVGDWVIIQFDDNDRVLATVKVYKSW